MSSNASNPHQFIRALRREPELHPALWQYNEPKALSRYLTELANERGFHCTSDEIYDCVQQRLQLDDVDFEVETDTRELTGWLPCRIITDHDPMLIQWCYLGDYRCMEPFFQETVKRCLLHPFNQLFRFNTPIDILDLYQNDCAAPSGFIYHLSRCGSTLVARLLSSMPQCTVFSEPDMVDAILRMHLKKPAVRVEQQQRWLRGIVHALGCTNGQDRYFIKLDSWHALARETLEQVFPGTPSTFLYRNPVEVVVSHVRQPGMQAVPGLIEAEWFGWELDEISSMRREKYTARVLGRILQSITEFANINPTLLVNYNQLPNAVWDTVLPFFNIGFDSDDVCRMRGLTRSHSKTPAKKFESDSEEKMQAATKATLDAVEKWAMAWYERIEGMG